MAYVTPGTPNVVDYLTFLQAADFTPDVLNPASPWIQWTLDWAIPYVPPVMYGSGGWCNTTTPGVPTADSVLATQAVYNLATSFLLQVYPDESGETAFQEVREQFGILGKGYGLITSAGDQGTSAGYMVPQSLQNLTLQDLQNLKNPWGAAYEAFMQNYGSNLWGLS